MIQAMYDKYRSGTHYLASSFWKDVYVMALQKFLANSTDNQLDKVRLRVSRFALIFQVLTGQRLG